jgi:outer membrane lipoprotein-sorting protein
VSVRKFCIWAAGVALLGSLAGCASRTTRVAAPSIPPPALTATREQLLDRYEAQAGAVNSLNAAIELKAETGSAFSGVIKSYHQITALFAAERPAWIRVVGQAPVVGTDIFDMVSDGQTFRMYVPSKKRFVVGPSSGGPRAKNTIENLRPQPLFDALIWAKIPPEAPVLIEQEAQQPPPQHDYVLTVLRRAGDRLEIERRIWFDRSDLRVARIDTFGSGGQLESDVRYSDWREQAGSPGFPWQIVIWRPREDYKLELDVIRLTLNPSIPASRFVLEQPPGTERQDVGQAGGAP